MDLFEEIRKREEDKRQRQEEKVKKLRQKLNKVDHQFFEDESDGDLLKRRELLTFQPKELQTVFVEESNSSESQQQQQTGCLTFTTKLSRQKKQSFFPFLFFCALVVPNIVVTPPTPENAKLQVEQKLKKMERDAFFRKLMESKKPLLKKQNDKPSTSDMTREESIARYIAAEVASDASEASNE